MILNKIGDGINQGGVTYTVGERIYANEVSEYFGLFGTITEIRSGEDKETENDTLDIYCAFDEPVLHHVIQELEKRFSSLYGSPKKIEDISLDMVIMAPEMIVPLKHHEDAKRQLTIYMISEEWIIDGEGGYSITPVSDYREAQRIFSQKLAEDARNGCISIWMTEEDFEVEHGRYFYQCWLDGRYLEDHYKLSIAQETLMLSPLTFSTIGRAYLYECRREDFTAQIEQWEECAQLSDEQYQRLIHDPSIPERIHSKLGMNDGYMECYWESVSEVGHELVNEYLSANTQNEGRDHG